MKLSNETKIGILAIVAIAVLILGFNFLKGQSLFDKSDKLYAVFHRIDGLTTSNAVIVNGLQIGTVHELKEKDRSLDSIVVTINLSKDIDIPVNSVAYINKDLLGAASVAIELGNADVYVKSGDTLNTQVTTGIMEDVKASLNPALNSVNGTLKSVDSLIEVMGGYFDPNTRNNFQRIITNLSATSASLQSLLQTQSATLSQTLGNMNQITGNLARNNENINRTLTNLEKATSNVANLDVQQTMDSLNYTVSQLNSAVSKINTNDGSIGLLLNDKRLYQNLENTTRSLNILMDDLRVHPRRYVNISIFGRKDKKNYLTAPLDTVYLGNK
jgi:phospholipid/cholesterol/gamma-HCH transport system substrate-binding protein